MGMFDEVEVPCPECGEKIIFQSKSGSCLLSTYSIHHLPQSVLDGIVGDTRECDCGHIVSIKYDAYKEWVNAWDYVQ